MWSKVKSIAKRSQKTRMKAPFTSYFVMACQYHFLGKGGSKEQRKFRGVEGGRPSLNGVHICKVENSFFDNASIEQLLSNILAFPFLYFILCFLSK